MFFNFRRQSFGHENRNKKSSYDNRFDMPHITFPSPPIYLLATPPICRSMSGVPHCCWPFSSGITGVRTLIFVVGGLGIPPFISNPYKKRNLLSFSRIPCLRPFCQISRELGSVFHCFVTQERNYVYLKD